MRLGQKIAELRKKDHLFQEALAEKMNVSRQAVSIWGSDQSIPDIEKSWIYRSFSVLLLTTY
ncbi:helix-turn-helix domain-containing protein [Lactobacillus helveticus]|uniref:helix-turn-helix transcriptional regulator n=1 Tax=Lactobacillus helveticus TaxID=1587 RepID=UPI001C1E7AC5|nr:helix-turn-helix transcriptional regulator [Lactobacillus helveticus]MBU6035180.1 helix-turn-helix domain-containing protein [Lactobacillus helveticus]